jgi:hypothetical protein
MSSRKSNRSSHFETMAQVDVPQGRAGKHKQIVSAIVDDLDHLQEGSALRIPLDGLVSSKEKVRSALNRATRKAGRAVATASDDSSLYIWNTKRA